MDHPLRTAGIAVALTASLALTACGDDTDDDAAAFCDAGRTIEEDTAAIDSPEAAVTAFNDLDGTIDDLVDTAPDEVADDAESFRDLVDAAVETGDFAAFEDGTIDEVTARMDSVCPEEG